MTLDELLAKSAQQWTDEEVLQLIEGFRAQRERWNLEQAAGSKKRISSKTLTVSMEKRLDATNRDLAFEGLKL